MHLLQLLVNKMSHLINYSEKSWKLSNFPYKIIIPVPVGNGLILKNWVSLGQRCISVVCNLQNHSGGGGEVMTGSHKSPQWALSLVSHSHSPSNPQGVYHSQEIYEITSNDGPFTLHSPNCMAILLFGHEAVIFMFWYEGSRDTSMSKDLSPVSLLLHLNAAAGGVLNSYIAFICLSFIYLPIHPQAFIGYLYHVFLLPGHCKRFRHDPSPL